VLHDRLMGVLCLGAASLAATWGGNTALHHAPAEALSHGRPPAHADAVVPGETAPDTAPAPVADPSTTAPTAPTAPPTTARVAASATTATTRPVDAAVLARRALLAATDVPPGFSVTVPAPADGAVPSDSPVERCAGPDAARLTAAIGARARSATFARPDTGSVSSSAVVFDQPASADKVLGALATPAARSCFETLINARLARNPHLSQDVHGSLGPAPTPSVGEGALAYRFDVRFPAEDVDRNAAPDDPPVRYVADFVFIRKGRTLVVAEFDNLRQPWVDTALRGVAAALVGHI
jgi:hypothetical protein